MSLFLKLIIHRKNEEYYLKENGPTKDRQNQRNHNRSSDIDVWNEEKEKRYSFLGSGDSFYNFGILFYLKSRLFILISSFFLNTDYGVFNSTNKSLQFPKLFRAFN